MRRLVEVGTPKLELRQFCGTCRSPVRVIYRSCAGVQNTQLRTNANDRVDRWDNPFAKVFVNLLRILAFIRCCLPQCELY